MPKGLAIACTFLGVAGAMVLLWALSGHRPEFLSTYGLLAILTLMIGFSARKILTGETPWWSPHAFVLLTMFLYFVVASTAAVHYRLPSYAFGRPFRPDELNTGMTMVILSMGSYLLGFGLGPKKQMFSDRVEWFFTDTPNTQVRFNLVVMVVFLVGIAAWVGTFAAAGGVGAHMQNVGKRNETLALAGGVLLHLTKWAYVGFFLYFARNGIKPISIAMFGVLMLIYLAFGSRNWVGMFLVGTAVIYRMRFGKIPAPFWIGGVVALAFVQSFLVLLRNTSGDVGMAQYVYQRRMQTTEGFVLSIVGDFAFLSFLSDTAVSMGTVIPYQWGKTLLSFFYVIPQLFWNPQDFLVNGADLYMQHLTPDAIGVVSVGPSLIGEFVMNFGWVGAIILPLGMGYAMRWFSSATVMHPHRRFQVAFPVMAAIAGPQMLSFIKHGFIQTATLPYLLLPLVIPDLPNITYLLSGAPRPATASG